MINMQKQCLKKWIQKWRQAHTPQLLPPLKKTTSNKTGIPATTETLKISNTTTSRVQTATLSSSTYRSPIGNRVLTFFIAVQPI
jgi:hypothetical protein